SDFPLMNSGGFPQSLRGPGDAFVAAILPNGALTFSTYLGGTKYDQGNGIAVDINGNFYVSGFTDSTDFPTKNAFQAANGGGFDFFIRNVLPHGSDFVFSTYYGGGGNEGGIGEFPNVAPSGGIVPSGGIALDGS